jgi:hypothetical protein
MEAAKAVSLEVTGWAVAFCGAFIALAIALGGFEGQLGEMFSIPGLSASLRVRIVLAILAFAIAVSAIPLSNAVSSALF